MRVSGELVAVRCEGLELCPASVAVRLRGRRTRAELAGARETVGVAQACLPRGVTLELGDVAHRHFLSMRYGSQRAHLRREHLLVPSEEGVRGAADAWDAKRVSSSEREVQNVNEWKYLWLIREMMAPVPPYGASCPGGPPIPQLFVRKIPMILSS